MISDFNDFQLFITSWLYTLSKMKHDNSLFLINEYPKIENNTFE